MIVVLDTNIVASATFWRGKPAHCLEAWALGAYDLAVSHPILTEYEEVIARLAARYPAKQPTDWLSAVKQAAHLYLICLPSLFGLPEQDQEPSLKRQQTVRAWGSSVSQIPQSRHAPLAHPLHINPGAKSLAGQ